MNNLKRYRILPFIIHKYRLSFFFQDYEPFHHPFDSFSFVQSMSKCLWLMMIPPSGMNERNLLARSEERFLLAIIFVCFRLCIWISRSELIILADNVSINISLTRALWFCGNSRKGLPTLQFEQLLRSLDNGASILTNNMTLNYVHWNIPKLSNCTGRKLN